MAKTLEEIQRSMTIGTEPPSDDDDKNDGSLNVAITKTNEEFNPTQSQIQERVKFIKRGHESALMNDTTRSSVVIRHDGQINVSANRYAQYKLNPSGKIVEEALESVALSNRRKVQTDDMVLNEHKLNPYLYELTDIKKLATAYNDSMLVGNFCLFGSVLTMSWDMNLKRYVLIRRPARMPMFSPVLNVPEINTGLGVTDPLKIDEDILAKSTKGYQVNAVISDSNSLIGKEGQARYGTDAGNTLNYGTTVDGNGNFTGPTSTPGITEGTSALRQWFQKIAPYASDDVYNLLVRTAKKYNVPIERALATCAAESQGNVSAVSPVGALGLMQLMPETASGLGVNPYNADENVDGGVRYLKEMYEATHDWSLAHAAYNAGLGNVQRYGGIPPFSETQNYVSKINGFVSQVPAEAIKN